MTKSNRFKFPKWTVTIFTGVLLILMIITYVLKQNHPEWKLGNTFLLSQVIALVAQLVLNIVNWRSTKKIVILATLFISATIVASAIWQFISVNLIYN